MRLFTFFALAMAQHSTAHTHPHPLLAIAMFVHTTKAAAAAPSKTGQPFKFFFQFWEIFFLSWSLSVLPGKRIFLSKTFPLLSGTGFHGCIAQSCSLTAAWTVHSKNNMSAGNQFISFKAINHSQIGFQFNPSLDITILPVLQLQQLFEKGWIHDPVSNP